VSAPVDGLQLILAPTIWLSGALIASAHHLSGKPGAALRLSPTDAGRLGVSEGMEVAVELGGETIRLPARVDESLPVGVAQAPEAFPGALLNRGGATVRVSPAEKETVGA